MEDYILEPQTITLEWKLSKFWKEEIKALPSAGVVDCPANRIARWIKNDPQFSMNDDCQKHALELFATAIIDYMQAT